MSAAVHISLEEFLARPDRQDGQREELITGELIVSPGAKPSHAEIVDVLREQLACLKQQGYVLRNDFSCVLGGLSMPVPDLAVVEKNRWDRVVEADEWLQGSPELVIEVSSPGNRQLQRKASIYLEHGAEQVWIVYPKTRVVTVMTPQATRDAGMGDALEFHGARVAIASIFSRVD